MNKEEIKIAVLSAIDKSRDEIINIGRKILKNPEMGYKETKTAKTVSDFLSSLA